MLENEIGMERVSVALPNGAIIDIEVSGVGRKDVSSSTFSFDDIATALEGITTAIKSTLERAKPQKATVKFGLEASVEAGKLTAAIVKGAGKANLEITLEWNDSGTKIG